MMQGRCLGRVAKNVQGYDPVTFLSADRPLQMICVYIWDKSSHMKTIAEGMASFSLNISPWGAMGGLFMIKFIRIFKIQIVQLSETVHHWTPHGK